MFQYLKLLRDEFWYTATKNTTIIRAGDPGCIYVGSGISLEEIKYLDQQWEIPILTNVQIIGRGIYSSKCAAKRRGIIMAKSP